MLGTLREDSMVERCAHSAFKRLLAFPPSPGRGFSWGELHLWVEQRDRPLGKWSIGQTGEKMLHCTETLQDLGCGPLPGGALLLVFLLWWTVQGLLTPCFFFHFLAKHNVSL